MAENSPSTEHPGPGHGVLPPANVVEINPGTRSSYLHNLTRAEQDDYKRGTGQFRPKPEEQNTNEK